MKPLPREASFFKIFLDLFRTADLLVDRFGIDLVEVF
jgi:hypothetical protein